MYTLLASSPSLGGVTADVKIWNRNASFVTLMASLRYWFAFNVERGCQSFWGCVGCVAGPMAMYKAYDLDRIVGPWSLQRFGGKETTFGDDRHLTNRLLSLGIRTRFTHRTSCQSESPTTFVRWVKQQTRWSRSFSREAFWFPTAFAYQSFWLTVETTKQTLYPFILTATVLHFLYRPTNIFLPVAWLATMFGVAVVKSLFALAVTGEPRMLLFSFYGVLYFFGLLPSVSSSHLLLDDLPIATHGMPLTENLCDWHHGDYHLGDFSPLIWRNTQDGQLLSTLIPCRTLSAMV
jgi:hyaluronan synthase